MDNMDKTSCIVLKLFDSRKWFATTDMIASESIAALLETGKTEKACGSLH